MVYLKRLLAETPPKARVRELHSGKLLGSRGVREFLEVRKDLEDDLTQHCSFIIIVIINFFLTYGESKNQRGKAIFPRPFCGLATELELESRDSLLPNQCYFH